MGLKSCRFSFFVLFLLGLGRLPALAEEPVSYETVVRADKFLQSDHAASEIVIDRKQIENSGKKSLDEVLGSSAGLNAFRAPGSVSSVFLRGAKSENILVLLDSVPLNDPTSPAAAFDFSLIDLELIEEIRVWSGGESVVWGSGALGGIIWLRSRAVGYLDSPKVEASYAFGVSSAEDDSLNLAITSAKDSWAVIGLANYWQSRDESAASENRKASEADYTRSGAGLVKAKKTSGDEDHEILFLARKQEKDLDRAGPLDDPNSSTESSEKILAWTWDKKFSTNSHLRLGLRGQELLRSHEDHVDPNSSWYDKGTYRSQIVSPNVTWWQSSSWGLSEMGLAWTESRQDFDIDSGGTLEKINSREENLAAYYRPTFQVGVLKLIPGLRREQKKSQSSDLGSFVLQWDQSAQSRFSFEYFQGLKWPTVYQQSSTYGNPDLRPERIESILAHQQQHFSASSKLSLNISKSWYRQMIDYDFVSSKYFNQAVASTWGYDLTYEWRNLSLAWEEYFSQDQQGLALLRHPRQAAHGWWTDSAGLRHEWGLRYDWRGPREDVSGSQRVTMDANNDIGLFGIWYFSASKTEQIRLDVSNLLEETSEEIAGFRRRQRVFSLSYKNKI